MKPTETTTNTASRASTEKETGTDTRKETSGNAFKGEPLEAFFLDALKDMYWAEKAITEALPKMRKGATTEALQDAFEDHELQTRKHISRLEKVFELIGEKAAAKKCEAMAGIIKECEEIQSSTPEGSMTRDAAMIIAAQKVEHYEIASYGGLVQLALTLGHDKAARLLDQTLAEEEDTDQRLTGIAEDYINFEASEEGNEKEDGDEATEEA